jgi:hypothetical protein
MVATLLKFTDSFYPSPRFFTGTGTTQLVPDIFPIAVNGRPYLVDTKSGQFTRGFEPRVRDSVDQSTSPGEAAINPQGLWRRGETSWHYGAGQKYADTAEAQDFRFFSSKGVNPWAKGQATLLNAVKESLNSSNTNLEIVTTDTRVYVMDGANIKYSTDPFASSPTWTTITGMPAATPRDMTTDGTNIYATYPGLTNSFGLWKYTPAGVASNVAYGHQFGYIDFIKGFFIITGAASAGNGNDLYFSPSGNVGADDYEHPVASFEWIGSAAGQTAIYLAGYSGSHGAIYKLTIKADGTLDTPVVALELPFGEVPTAISSYLGAILIGTNKGVRYAIADSASNLTTGALIPTSGAVRDFTSEDRFVWFTWSNYDGVSTGLGRLDLGTFIATNTPAHATDLMHTSTANVLAVSTFANKRVFAISGDGIYVEDTANLVTSGEIVTGTYRWGIPDRKFVAKFDVRTTPLLGTVTPSISLDSGAYLALPAHANPDTTEHVATGPQTKFIEASFKLVMDRATATTGPTLTRWMARAYASPARSQVFRVPILMHHHLKVKDVEYYFDIETELNYLRDLVTNPRVINYQENTESYSVIVEDLQFNIIDALESNWDLEGTCIITMRSVQD